MLGCQKDGLENSAGSIYFPHWLGQCTHWTDECFTADIPVYARGIRRSFHSQSPPKGKGQTHLELQVFHKYIFNSIRQREEDPAELLPQLFIPFNLSATVPNPIRCWAASGSSIYTQLYIGVLRLLLTATQSYWLGLGSSQSVYYWDCW